LENKNSSSWAFLVQKKETEVSRWKEGRTGKGENIEVEGDTKQKKE
jgi:hypothetical protein